MGKLQAEKFPMVRDEMKDYRAKLFREARRYRLAWATAQVALIVLGAGSTVCAGLAVGDLHPGFKTAVLGLTAAGSALNAVIAVFRLADLPLQHVSKAQEITHILADFTAANRVELSDEAYREIEAEARRRLRSVWQSYALLEYAPLRPENVAGVSREHA